MKVSKHSVKAAMRARRSSKPKFIGGRESAIEGAEAVERGARMALVEKEGSKRVDIVLADDGYAGFVERSVCEKNQPNVYFHGLGAWQPGANFFEQDNACRTFSRSFPSKL